jgi:CBS domain-containing protein
VLLRIRRGLAGILTTGDLAARVLAEGRRPDTQAAAVMTPAPLTPGPNALGLDALHLMAERGISHLPIVANGALVGILTQADLVRHEAQSAARLVAAMSRAGDASAMVAVTARIPQLLAHRVAHGARPHVIARMITDIADAATRRLLALADATLGAPPAPYLWLACGSQGRQEQTGVPDQENCLILSDDFDPARDDPYFAALAHIVSDGLDACGYVDCPGEMMAAPPRWRRPLSVWRGYFAGRIRKPDPMARMLASVMSDLRPIDRDASLFGGLHAQTLGMASRNSIYLAHMTAGALKHQAPVGMLRGLALIRSGDHRDTIDLKHHGVVPAVDPGRLDALIGRSEPVNTRARLQAARDAHIAGDAGGADLLAAYDLICAVRLRHHASQARRGAAPDNYMAPSAASELDRAHLRDAFLAIRTMQQAAVSGRGGGIL